MAEAFVKLTVNLTPKSNTALHMVSERNEEIRTVVVNRAIQLYDFISTKLAEGKQVCFLNEDGEVEAFRLL